MRVLHLLCSTGFHGAERVALGLIEGLAALGVENHVVALRSGTQSNVDIARRSEGVAHSSAVVECGFVPGPKCVSRLAEILVHYESNVVHSHGYKADIVSLLLPRVTRVATCHNLIRSTRRMRVYASIDKLALSRFDAVATLSPGVYTELRQICELSKLYPMVNGIDANRFRPGDQRAARRSLGLDERSPIVGYVGRLVRAKGVQDLIAAFNRLPDDLADVTLVIVGDGVFRGDLEDLAASSIVTSRIKFLGEISDPVSVYQALDLLVLPSYEEALPMVLLEAMATELPILATNVGAIPDLLEKGDLGLLVTPGDPQELTTSIVTALRRGRTEIQANGRKKVAEKHSSSSVARAYLELYKCAIGSQG